LDNANDECQPDGIEQGRIDETISQQVDEVCTTDPRTLKWCPPHHGEVKAEKYGERAEGEEAQVERGNKQIRPQPASGGIA
jgi:hypothetical protein